MFSYWQQDTFLAPADVVIVGAGFAGLWCAYEMKIRQPNLKITVLEKDPFPGGASVRNAGFACFGSPGEMLADTATMGETAMWQTVTMRFRGIQKLRRVLGDAIIDYNHCGGYECFMDSESFQPVEESLPWLNKGMKEVTGELEAFTVANQAIPQLGLKNFQHLVANQLEGGLHSGKALKALWQRVSSLGVMVLFGYQVKGWETAGSSISIKIAIHEVATLKAARLVLATNAFTASLTDAVNVQPGRGQILLTEPIAGLQLKGTFHFDQGFYYWRNVGNRILLGGARNTDFASEHTYAPDISESIQAALETFLHRHISVPDNMGIEHRWAGIMGFTETKQPLVQQIEAKVWAIVACNGMGVALTPIMAEALAARLLA